MALVDYLGFRLIAMSVVPICVCYVVSFWFVMDKERYGRVEYSNEFLCNNADHFPLPRRRHPQGDSLVYGSADAGRTMHASSGLLNRKMLQVRVLVVASSVAIATCE